MAGPDPAEKSPGAWVWLARIRRPQGRKGEVFAEILTDFPEKFNLRRKLWLVEGDSPAKKATAARAELPRPVELVGYWLHKDGIVLHFAGVDSISAAEALAGLAVAVPRAEREALDFDAGEAYISDLIGCRLFDVGRGHPEPVGEIEDVARTAGPAPLLMVRGKRGEILIPWAKDYLRVVDTEAKVVEMVLPEGLADLNAPE
jgi:16S rRNA processing protein RimM